MLKVGITGGIGTGKSVVCQVFKTLGIPVFNADDAAKFLMEYDSELVEKIKDLFGSRVYIEGRLQRDVIGSVVFKDKAMLNKLNALVHPATVDYGRKWMKQQHAPYIIKEAAIFFESGTHVDMDVMIGVDAPLDLRIKRVLSRDNKTVQDVQQRINNQMDNSEKMKLCDHVIINDEQSSLIAQTVAVHNALIK